MTTLTPGRCSPTWARILAASSSEICRLTPTTSLSPGRRTTTCMSSCGAPRCSPISEQVLRERGRAHHVPADAQLEQESDQTLVGPPLVQALHGDGLPVGDDVAQ